jgi:hypothetical protein
MENLGQKPYTAEEKIAILRRHLVEKVTGPDLCDGHLSRILCLRDSFFALES